MGCQLQYIGDSGLNAIYEIRDDMVHLIAGTGEDGRKDGDGPTEVTFRWIRSVAVLPKYIAVLEKYPLGGCIRLIDRATYHVTHLSGYPSADGAFQLLNASQSTTPNTVSLVDNYFRIDTYILPTPENSAKAVREENVVLFRNADSSRLIIAGMNALLHTSIGGRVDDNPAEVQDIDGQCLHDILPVYCSLSDSLYVVKYGDIRICKGFLGKKEVKRPSTTFELSDVSKLLDPSGLQHDLEITHKASNTTFKLLRSVIERKMYVKSTEASQRLALFIIPSKLPVSIITRFIEHLYFKPLVDVDSQQLITLAWISKEVFGREDPTIISALKDRVDSQSDPVIYDLLISSWVNMFGHFELDETSLIVATLLPRVQLNRPGFKTAFDAAMSKQANLHLILSRMTSLLSLVAGPSLASKIPEPEMRSRYLFDPCEVGSVTSQYLNTYTTNYVLSIPSFASVGVCGWLLYVHWPWFKRLVDSGLQESKSRIITLPRDSFTAQAAHTVVSILQYGHMDSFDHLNQNDVISIIEHASTFDLIDHNGKVLSRMKPLIDACEARVYPLLSPLNCWDQLRLAHSTGSSRYQTILQSLPKVVTKIEFDDLADLPPEVAHDLAQMLRTKKLASTRPAT